MYRARGLCPFCYDGTGLHFAPGPGIGDKALPLIPSLSQISCTAVKTVRRNRKDTSALRCGAPSDLGESLLSICVEKALKGSRAPLPSLEGIQQDSSGSPPKHSLALDGVSGLDISLLNLFWPDLFFPQPGMCKLIPKCLCERPVTLITEIFLPLLLRKKKKSVTFYICFLNLMVKHCKSMFAFIISLELQHNSVGMGKARVVRP